MPYLGRPVTNAGQFEIIDDISSSFNGSNTSFTLQVGGTNIQPDSANVTIALDGIIQIPPTSYSITGSTLNFSEAPENGTGFHGVLAGQSQFIESDFITDTHIKSTANISGSKINTDFSAQNIQITHITSSGNISGSSSSTISAGTFTGTFSGAVSSSVLSSPSQGTVRLATNGVNTDVDTGLQSGDSPTFTGGTITGNLLVGGTITAQEVHTEFESASILFTSGSTQFGNSSDDIQQMTGSVRLHTSGSAIPLRVEFEDDTSSDTSPEHFILQQNHAVNNNKIGISFNFEESDGGGTPQVAGIYAQLTQAASALSSMGSDLVFFTNAIGSTSMTEALRIDENGKVGIGTNNPGEPLHVVGNTPLKLERSGGSPKLVWKNSSSSGNAFIEADHDDFKIGFASDFSEDTRLYVSSSGKVGINTASPDTLLNLKDTGGIEVRLEADSNNSGQEDCFIRFYTDGKTQEGIVGMDNNNSSTLFSGNTENAMVFGCVSNLPVVFATNNTERMQITSAGNVGIGETSPSATLHIKNTGGTSYGNFVIIEGDTSDNNNYPGISFKGGTLANNYPNIGLTNGGLATSISGGYHSSNYNNRTNILLQGSDGSIQFSTGTSGSSTERMRIEADGAMGIGTSSPSGNLQVEGSNGAQLKLSSAKTSVGGTDPLGVLEFVGNDSSSGRSGTMARIYAFINRPTDTHTTNIDGSANEGTSLSFQTGIDTSGNSSMTVSEKMRLDKYGNLGIGGASFGPRLYAIVADDEFAAYFTSDSSSGANAAVAIRADSSSGDRKLISFYNGGSNVANITYNGGTATYGTGSDRRLKTNIIDFKDGLSLLNKVEVKKFDWITGRKQDVGIVAQDLYNTIPKVIVKGDDNETDIEQPWQVDYPRLVPYLINAVQELSSEITDLKKEVEALKG